MPPSILHITSPDLPTGSTKQLELLCRGLRQLDYRVHVCSLARHETQRARLPRFGGRLSFCRQHALIDPSLPRRLRHLIRAVAPDIVHTWNPAANYYGRIAARMARARAAISSVRSILPRVPWMLRPLDRWLNARSYLVVANAQHVRNRLIRHGFRSDQISVVTNGVVVSEPLGRVRSLHRELGIPDDAILVGVVGELRRHKRVQDLIWSLELLRVIQPKTHLVLVGDGDDRARLERFDRLASREPNVHFLGHRRDVPELMSQFFCLWQASHEEGCSNAVLEAMAAAVPVIASDVASHRAIIKDQLTGHLAPLGDVAEFARRANLLIRNPSRARELGNAGRDWVRDRFSADVMVSRYEAIYRQAIVKSAVAA